MGEQPNHDAFLALAVHELRTPLTAASGFAQTLADHLDDFDEAQVRELLARIIHNHRRLSRLVDDLVDLSRLRGGQLRVAHVQVDVGNLLRNLVRGAELGTREVIVNVAADLPQAIADPDRLEQVVANLLANGVKFSPEGSPIRIEAVGRDGHIRIGVTDQGAGIPPEVQERMFDLYYQGEVASGGGLGIGLFLVRQFCQLMGASVDVVSAPGLGSTFTVSVPAAV